MGVFFLSAALTAQTSPELHLRFYKFFYPIVSAKVSASTESRFNFFLAVSPNCIYPSGCGECSELRVARNLRFYEYRTCEDRSIPLRIEKKLNTGKIKESINFSSFSWNLSIFALINR